LAVSLAKTKVSPKNATAGAWQLVYLVLPDVFRVPCMAGISLTMQQKNAKDLGCPKK